MNGRRLARLGVAVVTGLTMATATALAVPGPAMAATDAELAARWAPVHYQDTDDTDYDADYLSPIDFDGEWDTLNNWEHQDDSVARLTGAVYYSVVTTSTHWFLIYGYYHPRDWCDTLWCSSTDSHENDMEGVVLTVRRDGSTYGSFEAMVSVAHSHFYSYKPSSSPYTSGRESIDGTVLMQSYNGFSRPTTWQESKGHGCKTWDGSNFGGGDGVVYFPDVAGEAPSGGNDRFVPYRLVDIFASGGLWGHRYDPVTFASWGTFRGDNGTDNSANAPWGWDDKDDGSDLPRGLLATDPAKLISIYFGNEGAFSLTYEQNAYR